ncbi:MAG: 2-dehydropantoate 2-reductase [Chloroflexi bacterium]|nr:MAG: 2-dehydropantoate 2-reductase [Chloroflexota bacterium]
METGEPPLLIVGTGAMASLFAARLSAAQVPLIMLGTWKEAIQALQEKGIYLVEQDGQEKNYPVKVVDDPTSLSGIKYALVLVKSWQTKRAVRQVKACLDPKGVAVTIQNGMGNYEILAQVLGAPRAALGTTTAGAYLLAPGRVQSGGEGGVSIGEHNRIGPLSSMLQLAGFTVDIVPDPSVLLWGKLVINAAINPITALLHIPNGEILNIPTARILLASAAREAAAVAAASGVLLPYPDPVEAAVSVARRTSKNQSSMLQDINRCTPTEIDAISGAIVKFGEQSGVPTPVNQTFWLLVKALEKQGNTQQ